MQERALAPGDADLARLVHEGDGDAYAALWARHHAAVRTAAVALVGEDGADALTERTRAAGAHGLAAAEPPRGALRPWLLRIAHDRATAPADASPPPLADPFEPPTSDAGPPDALAEAYLSLPERWRCVLWYALVDAADPMTTGLHLGIDAASTAALVDRARDGLRTGLVHVRSSAVPLDPACRGHVDRLHDTVRGTLPDRERTAVDEHVAGCARCAVLRRELAEVDRRLPAAVLPIVVGAVAGAVLVVARDAALADAAPGAIPLVERTVVLTRRNRVVATIAGLGGAAVLASVAAVAVAVAMTSPIKPTTAPPFPAPTTGIVTSPVPADPEPLPSSDDSPVVAPAAAPVGTEQRYGPVPPPPTTPPTTPDSPLLDPSDPASSGSRPAFSGRGDPGAVVEVLFGADRVVTTVGADGVWRHRPEIAVPDGTHLLQVTQIGGSGLRSEPVRRWIIVDTVALPPTAVLAAASAPTRPVDGWLWLPVLSGRAEPRAAVVLERADGRRVETRADDSGEYAVPLPVDVLEAEVLRVTQTDAAGNVSAPTPLEPLHFDRPTVAPAVPLVAASSGGGADVALQITGRPGLRVEILLDDVVVAATEPLLPTPLAHIVRVPVGEHRVGVRYADPALGLAGAQTVVAVTVTP